MTNASISFALGVLFIFYSAASSAENYEFIPPVALIEIKARSPIERYGSALLKEPNLPFWCGLSVYEEPKKETLSLQYIGSRKTWIPITGKVKEVRFYSVN